MYKVFCDDFLIFDTENDKLKIIDPKVDLELNKTGSFSFTIYPNHPHFGELRKMKSIIRIFQDNNLIFRGRILNDEQGFHNEKQITCEGDLAFLLDSIQRPYDFQSGTLHTTVPELFAFFINNHNKQVDEDHRFIVGRVTVIDPNNYIVRSDSTYLNTWDSIGKKLIEPLGGYLFVRHEADGNYIDYLADFETVGSQTIEFGKNLLDITKITKGEDVCTAIIPLGAKLEDSEERLTIESVNEGVDYLYDEEAVAQFGWIFKTVTWDDVTIASNLLRKAQDVLPSLTKLAMSIELNAVDLSLLDKDISTFYLGSYVEVFTVPHGLNAYFLVSKLSLDLSDPKGNILTLGTTYSTFTEQTSDVTKDFGKTAKSIANIENTYSTIQYEIDQKANAAARIVSDRLADQIDEDFVSKTEADERFLISDAKLKISEKNLSEKDSDILDDLKELERDLKNNFQIINENISISGNEIRIGNPGNELTMVIDENKLSLFSSETEIGYFQNRKFHILNGEFFDSLQVGKFAFVSRTDGNLSIQKVVT